MSDRDDRRAEWKDLAVRSVIALLAGVLVGAAVGLMPMIPYLLR